MWYGPFQILSTGRVESLSREIHISNEVYNRDWEILWEGWYRLLLILWMMMLFSRSVVSNSSRLHGLQHAKLLCPPLSSEVCSNSCPLRRWCYLIISLHVSFHGYSVLNTLFWEWSPYLWAFLTGELHLSFVKSTDTSSDKPVLTLGSDQAPSVKYSSSLLLHSIYHSLWVSIYLYNLSRPSVGP